MGDGSALPLAPIYRCPILLNLLPTALLTRDHGSDMPRIATHRGRHGVSSLHVLWRVVLACQFTAVWERAEPELGALGAG